MLISFIHSNLSLNFIFCMLIGVKGVYVKYHYHSVHAWLTDCNSLHAMLETNGEN